MSAGRKGKTTAGTARVHVDSLHAMGKRFVDAWHRAERGEAVQETHITFLDLEAMLSALSTRRLELLRHVRRHGAANVRELAATLGRDYKNVHQDVAVLESIGLLVREGRKLSAPWDEVQASVTLAPLD
jgi:predicted transcriptional regulator